MLVYNGRMRTVRAGSLVLGDGIPKICVPVTGGTLEEIQAGTVLVAEAAPDAAEWRADLFDGVSDPSEREEALHVIGKTLRDIPVLFTYRSRIEGGRGDASGAEYADMLLGAAESPEVQLIDVEARYAGVDTAALTAGLQKKGRAVIASAHDFSRTPSEEERNRLLEQLRATGADILKLAVMPQSAQDVTELLSWTERAARMLDRPLITMSMGDLGKISRISGGLTGSALTFGTVGGVSAPGQIPVGQLRAMLAQLR